MVKFKSYFGNRWIKNRTRIQRLQRTMNGKDAIILLRFILITVYVICVSVTVSPKKVKPSQKDTTNDISFHTRKP
jgi:hypothetical protein